MSIGTYISELIDNTTLSSNELAKELGMSYQNLMKLKSDGSLIPSTKVIKQLAQFEQKEESKVLYDVLLPSVKSDYPLEVLDYLSRKACEGYTIKLNTYYFNTNEPIYKYPFIEACKDFKKTYFGGSAFKKRSRNTFTVVDSWDDLKIECFDQFNSCANIIYTDRAWRSVFNDESAFYNNVLYYAFSKLSQYDEKVINYVIVTNHRNKEEVKKITRPITASNVHFIFEYSDVPYSSKYLRANDLTYLKKLFLYAKYCKDPLYQLPKDNEKLLKSCIKAYDTLCFSQLRSNSLEYEIGSYNPYLKKNATYHDFLYFVGCKHANEMSPKLFYKLLDILDDLIVYYTKYIYSKFPSAEPDYSSIMDRFSPPKNY